VAPQQPVERVDHLALDRARCQRQHHVVERAVHVEGRRERLAVQSCQLIRLQGLYRAALLEPIRAITSQFGDFGTDDLPFEQAIRAILAPLITLSLREDDHELNVARLHLREMLDPSPIFRDIVEREIAPLHAVLAGLVARHCGLARPDAEVHQLAFAMIAMANDYCSSREFIRMLAPAVLSRRNACAAIVDRLVGYCVALLSHEQARRKAQSKGASRGRRVR